jgi:hypothetical protein
MAQQAICKTVEVATTDTLIITDSSSGAVTINPSQTIYPNILALIADLFDVGAVNLLDMYIDSSYKAGTETPSPAGTITATYTPEHMFLPTYHTMDLDWFNEEPGDKFKGSFGSNGQLSGVEYTAQKVRRLRWPDEFNYNAMEKADDTGAPSNVRAAREARCFTGVVHAARGMVLAQSASNNLYCKGVYFIEDLDSYDGSGNLPTVWGAGDVDENYVFCSPGEPIVMGASRDIRRYYDLELLLVQSEVPTWGWDIT